MLSRCFGILFAVCGQILLAAGCEVVSNSSGRVSSSERGYFQYPLKSCWKFTVPDGQYIDLIVTKWYTDDVLMSGKVETSGNTTTTLDGNFLRKHIVLFDDVTLSIIASRYSSYNYYYLSCEFELSYKIESLICARSDSVRCGDGSCVANAKVCDGIKDCDDGKDEENCNFSRERVAGVNDSLSKGVSWLRGEMKVASRAWKRDTPRAITALYLADGVTFNGTCDEDEALVRELELKTAVAVMRNAWDPVLPIELAVLIHGLLVTCYDPRRFYGFDLVRMLDDLVSSAPNDDAQPLAILALCNAGQSSTTAQVQSLQRVLDSESAQPFLLDVQAVALMALSCIRNNDDYIDIDSDIVTDNDSDNNTVIDSGINLDNDTGIDSGINSDNDTDIDSDNDTVIDSGINSDNDTDIYSRINSDIDPDIDSLIRKTARRFQRLQRPDGSFGDIYTTAFVAQALMGAKGSAKWRVSLTLKYLMKQQANDSSFGDFLATYLVLPILNDRSLVDIANVKCPPNKIRPKEEDLLPDKDKKPDPKMTVKYSLYVGEEPDVVPTIALRMPYNRTAYQVLQAAAEANPKFNFECHVTKDKMYVYSITGIANDPEFDKFWLFYIDRKNNGKMELITDSPDKFMVKDGEHIIMWYKKTTIV